MVELKESISKVKLVSERGSKELLTVNNNNNNIYLKSNVHRDTSSVDYITITYNYNN